LVSPSGLFSRKLATNSNNRKEVQTSKAGGIFEPKTFLRRARQMKNTRQKSNGLKRHMLLLPVLLVAVLALVLVAAAPYSWADDDGDEIPFDEASIFFELNDTDGDLGIHALIDGEPWKNLEIEDPTEREMLDISVKGRLRRQGLTELFFESAEPSFDELDPEDFFRRFPKGTYEIEGETLEGDELESEVELSHVMPAPPENIRVNRQPAAEDCDAEDLPSVREGRRVIIRWDAVTESHSEIGEEGDIEVAQYQLVVEREEPTLLIYSVDLPPDVTVFTVPKAFIELGDEFKFEILVTAENGNRTAVESCFEVE
jgi:hypothetical protein